MGLAIDTQPELNYTHTRLLVDRFRETFVFYRDVLGFHVVYGDETGPYAEFRTTRITLALFDRHDMAESVKYPVPTKRDTQQPKLCLTFDVPDVDKLFGVLKERGATVVAEPTDRTVWMVRTAHFADPEGNLIEINSALRSQFRL